MIHQNEQRAVRAEMRPQAAVIMAAGKGPECAQNAVKSSMKSREFP